MDFKEIKEKLRKCASSVKYFDMKTFAIIMADRKAAMIIAKEGGDVQEFYRNSRTSKTRFYTENGGAYCRLLAILS